MGPRRIALLIETSRAYGRGLLRGVAAYARLKRDWSITYQERRVEEALPQWIRTWDGDGIIARIETRRHADLIPSLGRPVVDLLGLFDLPGVPSFDTDPVATARLAHQHFSDCGFAHLAFCGFEGLNFSDDRCAAFTDSAAQQSREVHVFHQSGRRPKDPHTYTLEEQANVERRQLSAWLRALPKPVGIFACNDARGRQVLLACREEGIEVPDQVAVIGVDNDPVICELADPPLTSIEPATQEMGFRGAELLDRMLGGHQPSDGRTLVAPTQIEARRSTDVVSTDDPLVTDALRYIRDQVCSGINVEDVLQFLGASRSTLERHFGVALGRSPKEHITRTRLVHVKRLLLNTDLPLSTIAQHTGFKTAAHLASQFKKELGMTPGEFRG